MTTRTPTRAPERSRAQRLDALARANSVRTARANLKRQVGALPPPASTRMLACLVRDPCAGVTDTMKVYSLLVSGRGMGDVSANRLLRRLHISPSKTLGGLSPRQRQQLGVALDELARQRRFSRMSGRHS